MMVPAGGSLIYAVVVGVLFAAGTYLVLQRSLTRILVGFGLMTHAANVLLLMAGGYSGAPPFDQATKPIADPLPQAFALTAIVISMAITALLLALAYRSFNLTRNDSVMDDVEDRRIVAASTADEQAQDHAEPEFRA